MQFNQIGIITKNIHSNYSRRLIYECCWWLSRLGYPQSTCKS